MHAKLGKWLKRGDSDLKEIVHGSAVAFSVKLLAAGSVFAMNVVVARQLGATEAGLFFLAYTIVILAATVGRLGLDNTFVRFIASARATNEQTEIAGVYRTGMLWSLSAAGIIAVALWLLAEPLAVNVFRKVAFTDVIRTMSFAVPLTALFILHAKALQGFKQIAKAMIVLGVSAPLLILLLSLLLRPGQATTTAYLFVVASGLTLVLGAFWWRQVFPMPRTTGSIDRGELLTSCIPLLVVAIFSQAIIWSSQIMLGAWASSADVAVFGAAQRTSMLASFVLIAVNSIAAPKFAAMYRMQQHEALRRSAVSTTRVMAILAIPPVTLMIVFPQQILNVFGAEFVSGVDTLRILAISQLVNVLTGSVGFLLSMSGHEKLLRNNMFVSAAAVILLGLILIPRYGITGAAIATGTGIAVQNLLGVWQVQRVFGFNTLSVWGR